MLAMLSRRFLYTILACLAAHGVSHAAEVELPTGGKVQKVDFERHVMGLLSKAGCNAGGCHGSFQGKNGFRLSLFGYEPSMDFASLTRDNLGRRVNVVKPDEKPAATEGDRTDAARRRNAVRQRRLGLQRLPRVGAQRATWERGSGEDQSLEINPPDFALAC